jgi:hypothetical protein
VEYLRHHGRTGRPRGDAAFLRRLERRLDRRLVPDTFGRRRKKKDEGE